MTRLVIRVFLTIIGTSLMFNGAVGATGGNTSRTADDLHAASHVELGRLPSTKSFLGPKKTIQKKKVCQVCRKSVSHLTQHMQTHTGDTLKAPLTDAEAVRILKEVCELPPEEFAALLIKTPFPEIGDIVLQTQTLCS